jgi:hypothetical protein
MAMASGPPSGGGGGGGVPPLHHHSRTPSNVGSSNSNNTNATASKTSTATTVVPVTEHVAECSYEFLLSEILLWVERTEKVDAAKAMNIRNSITKNSSTASQQQQQQQQGGGSSSSGVRNAKNDANNNNNDNTNEEKTMTNASIMAAERSAARIERMGYDVGYRLCERLAQHRPLLGPGSPSPEVVNLSPSNPPPLPPNIEHRGQLVIDRSTPLVIGGGMVHTIMDSKTQLEAVKFLCKEFWSTIFNKQIDKLQTNHRGVFVLKDLDVKWLRRLPPNEEMARVGAIRLLAFPCGLIRGALSCLGLKGAIVSCDFLADGKSMSCCSFNIKVK